MKTLNQYIIESLPTTITVFHGTQEKFVDGIKKEGLEDGDYYGELIGEMFNGNRHQIQGHLFVPFSYLKKHCFWKS